MNLVKIKDNYLHKYFHYFYFVTNFRGEKRKRRYILRTRKYQDLFVSVVGSGKRRHISVIFPLFRYARKESGKYL